MLNNAAEYFIDPKRVVISGDSAGGQLALSVGMSLHHDGYNVNGIVAMYPITQIITGTTRSYIQNQFILDADACGWGVSLYVYGDVTLVKAFQDGELYNAALAHDNELVSDRFQYQDTHHFANTTEAISLDRGGIETLFDPRVSPLLASNELLREMPATHIYAAEFDPLRDDSILFYNAAKRAGNSNIKLTVWQGAFHIEQLFSSFWMNQSLMPQSDIWISDYLNTILELTSSNLTE